MAPNDISNSLVHPPQRISTVFEGACVSQLVGILYAFSFASSDAMLGWDD